MKIGLKKNKYFMITPIKFQITQIKTRQEHLCNLPEICVINSPEQIL